jgi:hypothetical protein
LQQCFKKYEHYLHTKAQNLNENLVVIHQNSLGTSSGGQLNFFCKDNYTNLFFADFQIFNPSKECLKEN